MVEKAMVKRLWRLTKMGMEASKYLRRWASSDVVCVMSSGWKTTASRAANGRNVRAQFAINARVEVAVLLADVAVFQVTTIVVFPKL
jgi:hypothetical protein